MENQIEASPFDDPDPRRTWALEVEDKVFWVPREFLAMYSPVFNAMLYGEFAEANQNKIPLPGKKWKEVKELLLCMIPTPMFKEIDDSNVELILKFSNEYQIEALRK